MKRRADLQDRRPPGARRRTTARVAALLCVAALLGGCVPLGKPALRQNPSAPRVWDAADPAVLMVGSSYYLFGSTNNKKVPVRRITTFTGSLADSKTAWDSVASPASSNDAMPTRPAWVNPTRHNGTWQIWAPSAVRIGTTYYLYFSASRAGATDLPNDQCIGRATAGSPMGPYAPESSPLYCGLPPEPGSNPWGRGTLDPEVMRAPDGRLYMYVALSRTRDNIGVVRLDSGGRVIGGLNARPTTLVSQQFPWHDGTDNSTLTGSQAFLENPSMVYEAKTNTYLLFYSAGQWWRSNYVTGFARCAEPTGPCTADSRGPFLRGGGTRSAPGGLTAFRTPDGQFRAAYATWTSGYENQSGGDGRYSRQVSFAILAVGNTTDTENQTVALR
jgi:beta-xylosidase